MHYINTKQGECVSVQSPRELKKLFNSYLVSKQCTYNSNKYESDEHYEWILERQIVAERVTVAALQTDFGSRTKRGRRGAAYGPRCCP